jgi:hypothetical protein
MSYNTSRSDPDMRIPVLTRYSCSKSSPLPELTPRALVMLPPTDICCMVLPVSGIAAMDELRPKNSTLYRTMADPGKGRERKKEHQQKKKEKKKKKKKKKRSKSVR